MTAADVVAALEAERAEAWARRDRAAVDQLTVLIGRLTVREARELAANAQRVLLAARLENHVVTINPTDDEKGNAS